MSKSVTPNAISTILSNPNPDSSSPLPQLILQVLDIKPVGPKFKFTANDGKEKLMAMLQSSLSSQVTNGNIQNLGLIRIDDYVINDYVLKGTNSKYILVTECEVVSPPLDAEFTVEVKKEGSGIMLKPKQNVDTEVVTQSAAQIMLVQNGNTPPSARMAMTRRVHPLASLNPYQGNWTIKVRVTSKGTLHKYSNANGDGCVFNVELTDEDGTQIQATMFKEAAKKFYDVFEMGKVYYISKGTLKMANQQFKTVSNMYSMTLNESSLVELAPNEAAFLPEPKFDFVPIDMLGPYINKNELIDVIGVVQSVSPTMSIRRKRDNESIPKRDIVIADNTKKSVSVSLWNTLATDLGEELLKMVDTSPVVAIKSVRVSEFQGISLSTVGKSIIKINPDTPESQKLKSWYSSEGKETSMESAGAGLNSVMMNGSRSLYTDRKTLGDITSDPTLGEEKPVFCSLRACMSLLKSEQPMYYRACSNCKKKIIDASDKCYACDKNDTDIKLRYVINAKFSDATGGAWFSVFHDEATKLIGCSADELDEMKSQIGETNYQTQLKKMTWVPYVFRVMVQPKEYNNEKRQRITVKHVAPLDFAAESKFLLEEILTKKA